MPIYEYRCTICNNKFEILRSISQSDNDVCCPKCNSIAKKVFSKFASFAKDSSGASAPIAGSGSSCASCTSSSCGSCH